MSYYAQNARNLKTFSLLYLGLLGASIPFALSPYYEPGVSEVLLLLTASVGAVGAITLLLLPAELFTRRFAAGSYIFYAAFTTLTVFFTGASSSELYVLYFPLLLVSALHRSWKVKAASLISALLGYCLVVLPDILGGETYALMPVLFRFVVFVLVGGFALAVARRSTAPATNVEEDYYAPDEDGSVLLHRLSDELEARRGVQVAVVLVDPGREVQDLELLLERVRGRIGEPVLLGEGAVFGLVLSGVDDRVVESAARRTLAAAASLGARETRAGAAIYPRDARSAEDLLVAAGEALEAAFEVESPSAVVLASRPYAEGREATR